MVDTETVVVARSGFTEKSFIELSTSLGCATLPWSAVKFFEGLLASFKVAGASAWLVGCCAVSHCTCVFTPRIGTVLGMSARGL